MAEVDFSKTGVSPIGTPDTPRHQPVIDNSEAIATQNMANTINAASKQTANLFKSLSTTRDQTLLSDLSQQQLKLADAVDQGTISSDEARMRQRANITKFLGDNPRLAGDAFSLQKTIVGTQGLGAVVGEGTVKEQNEARMVAAAYDSLFIPQDATPEQVQQGTEDYIKSQKIEAELKASASKTTRRQADLAVEGKVTSNEKATLELEAAQDKKKAREDLVVYSGLQHKTLSNRLNQIVLDYQSGKIPSIEDANREILQLETAVTSITGQLTATAGGDFGGALVKPIENTFDTYKKILSGEMSVSDGNNKISNIKNRFTLMALSDESTARLVAVSNLFGNNATALLPRVDSAVVNFLEAGSKPENRPANPYPEPDQTSSVPVNTSLDLLKANMGSGDKETDAEINQQISSLFNGMDAYQTFIDSPMDLDNILSFIASDKVGRFGAAQGGFPEEMASKAEDVIATHYNEQLYPLLRDEFRTNRIFFGNPLADIAGKVLGGEAVSTPTPEKVGLDFRGSSVRFITSSKSSADVNKAKELNSTLAPILNRMVKVQAHLKGKHGAASYKAEWELMKDSIGLGGSQSPAQGQGATQGTQPTSEGQTSVIDALVQIESGGDPDAVSPAGAKGVAQIMPATAAKPLFGMKSIDLETSTDNEQVAWAEEYLGKLTDKYDGNLSHGLAAYNWGTGNVDKWIKAGGKAKDLPKETRDYLAKFKKAGVL